MTTDQLIAEITSGGFKQYDEAGLIDYISLRLWIISELKRFGSNIMSMQEAIININENKGELPENFWNFNVGVKCEPACVDIEDTQNVLQSSLFFRERLEGTSEWDNFSESMVDTPTSFIREDFYFRGAHATFYYDNPTYLKLMKGFNRSLFSATSPNLRSKLVSTSPYEINITGRYVNTNFLEGTIYMQYTGLDLDSDGKIIIPETQHNRLQEYLIYYCRTRILEDLWTGNDGDVANKIGYFNSKAKEAFGLALTETKMEGLGKNWIGKIRNKQRAESFKYDIMLPNV